MSVKINIFRLAYDFLTGKGALEIRVQKQSESQIKYRLTLIPVQYLRNKIAFRMTIIPAEAVAPSLEISQIHQEKSLLPHVLL